MADLEIITPHPDQVPSFVADAEQYRRFVICFSITRAVAQRDDVLFCRELYFSDMPTGDIEVPAASAVA